MSKTQTTHTDPLITVEEASKLLGVEYRHMLYGIQWGDIFEEGKLPPHKEFGLTLEWRDGCGYFNRAAVMANVAGK